jgi:hypothetical protein
MLLFVNFVDNIDELNIDLNLITFINNDPENFFFILK